MNNEMVTVFADELKELTTKTLTRAGVSRDDATMVADVLVFADLRGIHSHGVMRVEHYTNRIREGGMNLASSMDVRSIKSVAAVVDANGGLGHVAAHKATSEAILRAKEHGIGMVGVTNSSHSGAYAYYVDMALQEKLVTMIVGNTDALVVPFGAKQPFFGTNPFAFGFPGISQSMLLDMATSEVAFGKIFYAKEKNMPIPAGWAVDKKGNPTTDPATAAYLFPFGGPKGYGINMLVEMLSGVMVGGIFGPQIISMYGNLKTQRNLSSFHLVIDPTLFNGDSVYRKAQDVFDSIHSMEPAEGVQKVMIPGEIETNAMKKAILEGIQIPTQIYRFLGGVK